MRQIELNSSTSSNTFTDNFPQLESTIIEESLLSLSCLQVTEDLTVLWIFEHLTCPNKRWTGFKNPNFSDHSHALRYRWYGRNYSCGRRFTCSCSPLVQGRLVRSV